MTEEGVCNLDKWHFFICNKTYYQSAEKRLNSIYTGGIKGDAQKRKIIPNAQGSPFETFGRGDW